jgi:hypothetical protein
MPVPAVGESWELLEHGVTVATDRKMLMQHPGVLGVRLADVAVDIEVAAGDYVFELRQLVDAA